MQNDKIKWLSYFVEIYNFWMNEIDVWVILSCKNLLFYGNSKVTGIYLF